MFYLQTQIAAYARVPTREARASLCVCQFARRWGENKKNSLCKLAPYFTVTEKMSEKRPNKVRQNISAAKLSQGKIIVPGRIIPFPRPKKQEPEEHYKIIRDVLETFLLGERGDEKEGNHLNDLHDVWMGWSLVEGQTYPSPILKWKNDPSLQPVQNKVLIHFFKKIKGERLARCKKVFRNVEAIDWNREDFPDDFTVKVIRDGKSYRAPVYPEFRLKQAIKEETGVKRQCPASANSGATKIEHHKEKPKKRRKTSLESSSSSSSKGHRRNRNRHDGNSNQEENAKNGKKKKPTDELRQKQLTINSMLVSSSTHKKKEKKRKRQENDKKPQRMKKMQRSKGKMMKNPDVTITTNDIAGESQSDSATKSAVKITNDQWLYINPVTRYYSDYTILKRTTALESDVISGLSIAGCIYNPTLWSGVNAEKILSESDEKILFCQPNLKKLKIRLVESTKADRHLLQHHELLMHPTDIVEKEYKSEDNDADDGLDKEKVESVSHNLKEAEEKEEEDVIIDYVGGFDDTPDNNNNNDNSHQRGRRTNGAEKKNANIRTAIADAPKCLPLPATTVTTTITKKGKGKDHVEDGNNNDELNDVPNKWDEPRWIKEISSSSDRDAKFSTTLRHPYAEFFSLPGSYSTDIVSKYRIKNIAHPGLIRVLSRIRKLLIQTENWGIIKQYDTWYGSEAKLQEWGEKYEVAKVHTLLHNHLINNDPVDAYFGILKGNLCTIEDRNTDPIISKELHEIRQRLKVLCRDFHPTPDLGAEIPEMQGERLRLIWSLVASLIVRKPVQHANDSFLSDPLIESVFIQKTPARKYNAEGTSSDVLMTSDFGCDEDSMMGLPDHHNNGHKDGHSDAEKKAEEWHRNPFARAFVKALDAFTVNEANVQGIRDTQERFGLTKIRTIKDFMSGKLTGIGSGRYRFFLLNCFNHLFPYGCPETDLEQTVDQKQLSEEAADLEACCHLLFKAFISPPQHFNSGSH